MVTTEQIIAEGRELARTGAVEQLLNARAWYANGRPAWARDSLRSVMFNIEMMRNWGIA